MHWQTYFIEFSYLLASILFILGLKGLSHPETAKRGMHLAEFGMMMAIIGTLMHFEIVSYTWIIVGLLLGSTLGPAMGVWVPMTAMPQRTALSHAFGAFAAALVGIAEYYSYTHGFKPLVELGHLKMSAMGFRDHARLSDDDGQFDRLSASCRASCPASLWSIAARTSSTCCCWRRRSGSSSI